MIAKGMMVGRYRVLDCLGEGGMGIVYAAHDTRLDRRVALKFPDPNVESGSLRQLRFLEEAQATGRLDHPNICAIHEIGETPDGRMFIAMGLYEGATVKEMLSSGPLSHTQARDLASQVARGLAHAHRAGIVHRDIKPENLLVTREGLVKILDFGIAKREGRDLTRTGRSPGTLEYMSPEQVRGDTVDARTDIWSLGAVLYEMLTGERPFSAPRDVGVMHRILNTQPSHLKGHSTSIPPEIRPVLIRCLEKDTSNRYATAVELLDDLKPAASGSRGNPRSFFHRHRRMALTVAALLALSPLSLFSSPGRRLVESLVLRLAPAAPRLFAVLPISSADSADAVLAAGLTHSLTEVIAELAAGDQGIWVLPHSDMLDTGAENPSEVRRIYPVDLVVAGDLGHGDGIASLSIDLFDVRSDPPILLRSVTIHRPAESLRGDSARMLLAGALGIPRDTRGREGTILRALSASPAQRYYHLGVGQLQRAYDQGSLDAAIGLFQEAITSDSTFGPAYSGLCEAYWENYIATGDASMADVATEMCDHGYQLSRSDPLALVALGKTQYFTGQLRRAEETLHEAIARGAGADAHRWLGHVHEGQGDLESAEREYRQAIALRDDIWVYYADLGMMYTNAEHHEEASRWHREVIRLSPDNPRGYNDLGASQMFLNHLDEAEGLFHQSIAAQPTFFAFRNLGFLHLRDRRYDEAVGYLESGIEFRDGDWWTWRWLAHAQHWQGEPEKAREAWQRVVELAQPRLDVNPTDRDVLCGLAEALVALGDVEGAQTHLNLLASLELKRGYNLYWTGRVFEMMGSRQVALQYIHRALESDFDSVTVQNDPWLDDLRADPGYQGPGWG